MWAPNTDVFFLFLQRNAPKLHANGASSTSATTGAAKSPICKSDSPCFCSFDADSGPSNQMYELYDKTTIMFFFRNKHMMCDFGTGNNNKINWVLDNKDEMVDILEVIYKGARKGRGLVNSPKDYSTRHAY